MRTAVAVLLVALVFTVVPPAGAEEEGAIATGAADAANQFGFDLHRKIGAGGGNVFFSPYSVSAALAMTREGARGETGAQMDRVFRWKLRSAAELTRELDDALAPRTVKEGYGDSAKELPAYELSTANTVWAQEGLAVEPAFRNVLTERFSAPLRRLDFTKTEAARKAINDWVAKETKDRILDIVPEGLPAADTLMALANAIWFRGAWKDPFKEGFTKPGPFTTAAGAKVETPFMNREGSYWYHETPDAQVLEIPYRERDTAMIVVLPKPGVDLAKVERELTAASFSDLAAKLAPEQVSVRFPKFELTWAKDLAEVLPAMGMPYAFSGRKADFTGITKTDPLMIGNVLHKAWLKVDEAGTEAAAATVVMMLQGGAPSGEPIPFIADRPFLFAIRHAKTGAILFLGRLADPGK